MSGASRVPGKRLRQGIGRLSSKTPSLARILLRRRLLLLLTTMTSQQNINETAVADIEFVISECARLHEIVSRLTPKEFLKQPRNPDFDASLALSNGRALYCGIEALRRLYRLATNALRESDAAGTVEPEKVNRALQ